MVAKSEASMPMSRALAKLAVATDLGTAARPSTAAPVPMPYTAASAGGVGNGVGSGGGGAGGAKAASSIASGRSRLLEPSAARSVLASLPLPLSNSERQGKKTGVAATGPVAPLPGGGAVGAGGAGAIPAVPSRVPSGVLVGAAPSTPRLPPLPSHSPPPPSPQSATLAAAAAAAATTTAAASPSATGAQLPLPPATSSAAQPSISPRSTPHATPHPPQQQHLQKAAPPLPPCGVAHVSSSPGPIASCKEFSKELRDAARNHPGLAANLLARLHNPRKGPSTAGPSFGTSSAPAAATAALAQPPPPSGGSSSGSVRPLSPRSRARLTASLVQHGGGAAAAAAAAGGEPAPAAYQSTAMAPSPPHPHLQLSAPSAAMASLSPEALAVILGTPSSQPPSTASGLLVMRRAGPASVGAGAALRPSTAQQCSGSGGGGGGGATAAAGLNPGAAPPGGSSSGVSRPHVMPHITVPYKPGSIRLPPGGVPGRTAAGSLGGSSKGTSGPGSAVGSGSASPAAAPATSAGTANGVSVSPGELLRPWTTAGTGSGSGTLRPVTANPLTHCMPAETSAAFVVRVPRSATDAMFSSTALPGGAAAAPPSAARVVSAAARPAASASAPWLQAERSGVAGAGGGLAPEARQLTAEELRAVVAALAAARPEAAALLLPRPATAASADNDAAQGRPGGSPIRRPNTSAAGFSGNGADAGAQGSLWDAGSLYSRADGKPSTASSRTSSRTSSRATTRGSLLSDSAISMVLRDTSVYDDKWPRPTSSGSRPGSRGASTPGTSGTASGGAGGAGGGDCGGGGNPGSTSRVGSSDSRRPAISAWGSTRRPLQSIPEDAELSGGEEASSSAAAATSGDVQSSLRPLEPLESDPELDVAWASIVAANQRPDTAAARAPSSGINVFSRPPTGAIRITRQAAPMVLVLEDLTASTPEVLERELESLGLEELKALKNKLSVSQVPGPDPTKEHAK